MKHGTQDSLAATHRRFPVTWKTAVFCAIALILSAALLKIFFSGPEGLLFRQFTLFSAIGLFALTIASLVSAWYSRRFVASGFRGVSRRSWILLAAVFLLALAVRFLLVKHMHLMYTDEHLYMESAKNMITTGRLDVCKYIGEHLLCKNPVKAVGWPFMIGLAFMAFGLSNNVAIAFCAFLGSASVALIFILCFRLFRSESAGLWSAFFLSLFPLHVTWSVSAEAQAPAIFFLLLFFIAGEAYLREGGFSLFLLSSCLLFLLLFLRVEFLALVIFWGLILMMKKERRLELIRRALSPEYIVALLFFFLLSAQILVQLKLSMWVQTTIYDDAYFSASLILSNLMKGLSVIWHNFRILLVFPAWGLLVVPKRRRRSLFSVLFFFVLMFLFYLSFQKFQDRLMLVPLVGLVLLAGCGIAGMTGSGKGMLFKSAVITAVVLFTLWPILVNENAEREMSSMIVLESKIPEMAERDVPAGCYVITEHPEIISATTRLRAISLRDVSLNADIIRSLLSKGACVLFWEDMYCFERSRSRDSEFANSTGRCREMFRLFGLEKYIEYREGSQTLTFYRVLPKEKK